MQQSNVYAQSSTNGGNANGGTINQNTGITVICNSANACSLSAAQANGGTANGGNVQGGSAVSDIGHKGIFQQAQAVQNTPDGQQFIELEKKSCREFGTFC